MSLFEPATGRILEVNDAWVDLYGYSREEAHRMRVQDVSAEPDATSDAVRAALDVGGAHIDVRWHRKKDGTVMPVDLSSGTLRSGDRVLMYALMQDITPRVRAEQERQRSEARFRSLIESAPIGMLVHDRERVLFLNRTLRERLGYAEEGTPLPTALGAVVHADDLEALLLGDRRDRPGSRPSMNDRRFVGRDGSLHWMEVSGVPIELDGVRATLVVAHDIADRKRMEAQLVLADRLSSLGRLAASVGHEISNPLAYVLTSSELLARDLRRTTALDEATRERLLRRVSAVEQGAMRVRDIVRDLRTLSVGEGTNASPVDLVRVLDVCADMASHEIRHRARLFRDYHGSVSVRAAEARLGQVFLNLLLNAAEAIPEGQPSEHAIRITMEPTADDRVVVEVRDTGAGIAPEIADRIFEPFFTTKAGAGTGLGLSISHAIVSGLGGTITVEPNEPRGTCFRVVLPIGKEAAPARAPTRPPPGPLAEARCRVLVADDEVELASTLAELLEHFDVTTVHSGRLAIDHLATHRYDAVLLDLRMDDGGGLSVLRWMRDEDPAMLARVVVMTGAPPENESVAPSELESVPIVRKPFETRSLVDAIDRVLASSRPTA